MFKIGDKVSTVNAPGVIGTICQIGQGRNAGRFRVQWASKRTWIRFDRLLSRGG